MSETAADAPFCPQLPFHEAPLASTDTGWARFWAKRLIDPRDVVFVNTSLKMVAIMWPFAAAYYALDLLGYFSWWMALAYIAPFAALAPTFTLMQHCTVHRPLFNKDNKALNGFIPWLVGVFYGHTPHSFFAHHIGMHHKEGNLPSDLSTTMPYQRDRISSWLHYWAKFMLLGLPMLALYHLRKGRPKFLRAFVRGEIVYWTVVALLAYFVSWQATVVVFVAPVILMRSAMMMGNWGQHAFVDPDEPTDDFKSSITCINTAYNRRCFNDGYHIIHHLKPALHYSEMADEFNKNRELYGQHDAIVFDGYDFFQVWALLMLGQKKRLAKAFVRLPGAPQRSDEQVIEMINRRMRPFDAQSRPLPA